MTDSLSTNIFTGYEIEKVTPLHYPLLQRLYKVVFGQSLSINDVRKRFDTSVLGCELVAYIAVDKKTKTPAAYYGVFPLQLKINENLTLAAQSGDTMTHPDHRKRGLFIELAKLTFEECRKQGIKLIYGFPNDNSYHGFINKLNWEHIDDIERWDLKLNTKTFPFPKIAIKLGLFKTIYLSYARKILGRRKILAPDSFQNPSDLNIGKVNRDVAYLKYKSSSDKFFIEIDNVVAWIKCADVLWIGDLSNYKMANEVFFNKLRRLAFWMGYNTIVFNINSSVPHPDFLNYFSLYSKDASCFYYLSEETSNLNLLFTGADFDTW